MPIQPRRWTTIDRRELLRGLAGAALAAVPLAATRRLALASPTSSPTPNDSPAAPFTREGAMSAMNGTAQPSKPTVVLVHGAFADSSSWNGVIPGLLAQGYPVVAAANPLRSVKYDSDYVAALLTTIGGPIVLVGHSYGGIMISNAANGNGNVVGLVYVAGYAPDAGESATTLSERFPGSTLGPTLAPPVPLPDGGSDLYIQPDKFWAQFAADLPEAEAKLMAATQRPFTTASVTDPSGPPAWKTIPSRFIYGELDKNIPASMQAFMAERAGSLETVEVKGASHVVMISHPDAVANLIVNAATARTPAGSTA